MKNLIALVLTSLMIGTTNAQVGIGTTSPDGSSQLHINSTSRGLLMPRMTASQRAAISGPATGLLVFQTDAPAGFYYYTGSAWIMLATGASTNDVPAGTVVSFAGATAPAGWAFCDGSAISRSANAALFTAIATTYGNGNGSTTFNIPDLRGRAVYGKDNMGGSAAGRLTTASGLSANNTLGATGGNQTQTLSTANLPAHSHSFTGTSVSTNSNSHSHNYSDAYFAENSSVGPQGGSVGSNGRFGTSAGTDNDNSFVFRTSANGHARTASDISTSSTSHSHTVTAAGTVGDTGSGTAISNLAPAIVLNYIIKL